MLDATIGDSHDYVPVIIIRDRSAESRVTGTGFSIIFLNLTLLFFKFTVHCDSVTIIKLRQTMSHLISCVDAPNCTWTDLAMPTLAGVNTGRNLPNSNYRGLDEEY